MPRILGSGQARPERTLIVSISTLPIDQTVDLIARGLAVEIQDLLRKRLAEVAREILEPICKQAAENLVSRVKSIRRHDRDTTEVVVMFNQKKID